MIKGMTGFGSAQVSSGKVKGVVEIKSQNHRYFDITYNAPSGFGSIENKVRQIVNKEIKRGRVTVSVKVTTKPSTRITLHNDAVRQYLQSARSLKKRYGMNGHLQISDVINLPGVIETKEEVLQPDAMWPALNRSLRASLQKLVMMRKREGKSLSRDISTMLTGMRAQVRRIRTRAKAILREKKKTLSLDEFASFQKGSDINEEISRLTHYVGEAQKLLRSTGTVGKNLDFVAQEMQRETNTIGSKLQDKTVADSVIALKGRIEKLREQAQNIE